eukprot:PhM_4_TR15886/c4_g1_i3/m.17013
MRCLVPHPCPGCRVRANSSPTGRVHRVVRTERRPEQIVPCSQRNCKFGGTVKVSLAHKCQNCNLYVCRGHTDVKKGAAFTCSECRGSGRTTAAPPRQEGPKVTTQETLSLHAWKKRQRQRQPMSKLRIRNRNRRR